MGRTESYHSSRHAGLDHDHPIAYWQRLNSYQNSRPSSYAPSNRQSSYAGSRPKSYAKSPTRPPLYSDDSQLSSFVDSPTRPSSYHDSRPSSYTSSPSRPTSYADSRDSSYLSDDRPLTEKPPPPLRKEYLRDRDKAERPKRSCWSRWSRRSKCLLFGILAIIGIVMIAVAVGVVVHQQQTAYDYTPSSAHVTNATAFQTGGATHRTPNVTNDGIGVGQDAYIYYTGSASSFPDSTRWVSFDDMWAANQQTLQKSCGWLNSGADNSAEDIQDIYTAIQNRAAASLVDHRFIFAIILQESHGCVRVGSTTSSGGVNNPGLMQSHNGHSYSPSHSSLSILAMVQDGTQGTEDGIGLVQVLNTYGDPYSAARGYNSGHIASSGNLSAAAGATACYVSDVANRLTGWVWATSKCPGDDT